MTSPKIEITDEMVERGWKAVQGLYPDKRAIKDALTAALSPPEEPEIPVSLAMIAAGFSQLFTQQQKSLWDPSEIYRAMEKASWKEAEKNPPKMWWHKRRTDARGFGAASITETMTPHRRKDDPK